MQVHIITSIQQCYSTRDDHKSRSIIIERISNYDLGMLTVSDPITITVDSDLNGAVLSSHLYLRWWTCYYCHLDQRLCQSH